MKSMQWLALVVAAVVILNLRATGGAAGKTRTKPKAPAPPPAERVEQVVDGYGRTPQKARDQALAHAREQVEEMLAKRLDGSGLWPAPEQLDPDYLDRYKVIQPHGEPKPAEHQGEKMVVASYRVDVTPEYLREIVSTARLEKVQQRHLMLARVLGGILAVVLVTAAYLRLEESTHGYATKLLRLVAVIVLSLVGLGLLVTG